MVRALALLAALGGLALAGCGSTATGRPAIHPEHNAADVRFAATAVPHHERARELAELGAVRASSPRVRELAGDFVRRPAPEIDVLADWLGEWDEPSATTSAGLAGEIERLGALSGRRFDERFLAAMMAYHERLIRLAEVEMRQGRYGPAKALAERIGRAQSAEISRIRELQDP